MPSIFPESSVHVPRVSRGRASFENPLHQIGISDFAGFKIDAKGGAAGDRFIKCVTEEIQTGSERQGRIGQPSGF